MSVVYRYVIASIALFLYCYIKHIRLIFKLKYHSWFALMGLFMFCLNYILAYRAQLYITSALSAVAFSSMLWMNIINARLFFGLRSGKQVILGALVGISGIVVLFGPQVSNVSLSDSILYGCVLALVGALMASFGNMASQMAQRHDLPVVQSNAWSMFYGASFTAIFALLAGHSFDFEWSAAYVVSLLYLAIFGSVIAFGAYLTLLGRIGAHRAGYATVMFPVVALLFSMAFEGLTLDAYIVVGFLLVLAGNVLVLKNRSTPAAN